MILARGVRPSEQTRVEFNRVNCVPLTISATVTIDD